LGQVEALSGILVVFVIRWAVVRCGGARSAVPSPAVPVIMTVCLIPPGYIITHDIQYMNGSVGRRPPAPAGTAAGEVLGCRSAVIPLTIRPVRRRRRSGFRMGAGGDTAGRAGLGTGPAGKDKGGAA
jgi:hypothetical protein